MVYNQKTQNSKRVRLILSHKKMMKNNKNKFKKNKNNKKIIQKLNTFFCVFHFMIISLKSFRFVKEKLLPSTV